jgi:hypothetical protein
MVDRWSGPKVSNVTVLRSMAPEYSCAVLCKEMWGGGWQPSTQQVLTLHQAKTTAPPQVHTPLMQIASHTGDKAHLCRHRGHRLCCFVVVWVWDGGPRTRNRRHNRCLATPPLLPPAQTQGILAHSDSCQPGHSLTLIRYHHNTYYCIYYCICLYGECRILVFLERIIWQSH